MPFALEGKLFEGPFYLGETDLPSVPGIALVCTEAGEGVKIMSVVCGENIGSAITESPRNECWKKHAYKGRVDLYLFTDESTAAERAEYCRKVLDRHGKWMFCEEAPKIEDDF